jgi:polyphosphate kinase
MERNLLRRVEVCFPVLRPELAARVFEEELDNYLRDNTQAWQLREDGSYEPVRPEPDAAPYSAQTALLARLCG